MRLLFNILLVFLLNGCIGFRYWTSEGHDPLARVGEFPYVFTKFERAEKYTNSYDQRLLGTKLSKEHFLAEKVNSVLEDIESAYLSLSKSNIFNYYKDKFHYCTQIRFENNLCPNC